MGPHSVTRGNVFGANEKWFCWLISTADDFSAFSVPVIHDESSSVGNRAYSSSSSHDAAWAVGQTDAAGCLEGSLH